jgi:transposase
VFGKLWTKAGVRLVATVKPGYLSFWVYSAVCPATGEDLTLVMPRVCTEAMNAFLAEFAAQLAGRECILVMDRAGWHVSKELEVPPNIEVVLLPPYSPELNPVERLWQWLKRHAVRNRLFRCVEEVQEAVEACLRTTTAEFFRSLCRCLFLSI